MLTLPSVLLFVIFQELLQQSLSWPKMFVHSWSGLQVRDSFFSAISGKLRAFAIYQKTSETSVESAIGWRTCAILHSFLSLFSKFKMEGQILPWIAWISRILLKTWKWNSYFHWKNFQPENYTKNQTKKGRTGQIGQKIRQEIKQWIGQIIRQEIGKKLGQEIGQKSRQKYGQRRAGRKKRDKKNGQKSGQKRVLSNTPYFLEHTMN